MTEEDRLSTAAQGRRRSDAVRNRRRLLEATGELLRTTSPWEVTMPVIADRAGLSPATAYRYFSSVDSLMNAYLCEVIIQLRDYSDDCPKTGPALFHDVLAEWGRLVNIYGPAMAQMRSRRGFLERLQAQDTLITTVREAWDRPIRALLRGLKVGGEHFEHALFLYNMMFDPREILDLQASGMPLAEALDRLSAAYTAAIIAWEQRPAPGR
jgi:AcrR family transcriptional regulator